MMNDSNNPTTQIFNDHQNLLRRSEAIQLGIPAYRLDQMLADGQVIREARGLYRLADAPPGSNPDLVIVSRLVPKAVICLISALDYYELTTQIPHAVNIALPSAIKLPRIEIPPLDPVWLSPKPYSAGMDMIWIDGIPVKIYSPEKTIADCFKFRRKIGQEIAIEALKEYMRKDHPKLDRLLEYARINRVEKLLRPYLEALV